MIALIQGYAHDAREDLQISSASNAKMMGYNGKDCRARLVTLFYEKDQRSFETKAQRE